MGKWEEIFLGDNKYVELIMGQSPPSTTYNKEGVGLPFYQGKKDFGVTNPTPTTWCSEPKKIAEKNDILISVRAPVGPTNICLEKSCIGRGLATMRVNSNSLLTQFLLYYFKNFEEYISSKGQGSTFQAISGKELRALKIPLPPLKTQKQIVSKLDALFARIDKSIGLLEENIQHTKDLMASVLDGEFSAVDAEKYLLKNISSKIQYGYTGKTTEKGKYYYLRITDIQNGDVDFTNTPYSDISNEEAKKYIVNKGDILFARTGATAGKSFLFNKDENSIFASYLIRVVCKTETISPEYLYWYFQSGEYWQQIFGNIVGAAQPNFNGKKLGELIIPVPSIKIQDKLTKKFILLSEKNKKLLIQQSEKLKHLQSLKSSLLDMAFKGELVE